MESSSESEDEYCHMERPNLLGFLKQILEQYPNTSVLKEMLQNAEDAGATEFKVMVFNENRKAERYDERKYFEPPGLFIYNDAVFKEQDWKGISSLSNSIKCEDVSTVGKFGLGFKSVFHLTDVAVIISGKKLMIIDPFQEEQRVIHTVYLKNIKTKKWFKYFQLLQKGLSVFGLEDSNMHNGFYGTLFWFPLRQNPSNLSTEVFSAKTMIQLLDTFEQEAKMFLLFLLSVTKIQVFGCDIENPIYKVCVQREDSCLSRLSVAQYCNHLKTLGSQLPEESLSCTHVVKCDVYHNGQCHVDNWFVNHFFKGTLDCAKSSLFTLSQKLANRPCGGVAAPLSTNVIKGHTFCFLPLPFKDANSTGLPVHVNGFFALSPDRDHVKWAGKEESSATLEPSQLWNTALIEEVILQSYLAVIRTMCKNKKDPIFVYNLIPVENENTPWNWKIFICKLYNKLFEEKIFYTKNKGGSWIHKNNATFNIVFEKKKCKRNKSANGAKHFKSFILL